MGKKPVAYRDVFGGITLESARDIYEFLRSEADMDDDLTTVEYYNGILKGMTIVRNGAIHSHELEREIKAYGIEIIAHPTAILGDD